ncbi:MAG: SapC family protein [Xanthomonadales bacterium]|jgi:hypothetical protein|nr:SapC family protein [Xanthomonadales bacterium]
MARFELLNNVDHRDLRVVTTRSAELGDKVWYAPTFPHEFRNLQRHYPIFFTKNPDTGKFAPVAMFGFQDRENLFLDENGWHAAYIPLSIMRQPFLIGHQEVREDGVPTRQLVVSVDMESPRISQEAGERVFLPHGGNSEYLERVTSILNLIHEGFERSKAFADMLLGMELLESFVLDVELDDGSAHRLSGFYTIKEESLRRLPGDDLVVLNNNGFLEAVYMVIASMSSIPALVEKKNRLVAKQARHAGD